MYNLIVCNEKTVEFSYEFLHVFNISELLLCSKISLNLNIYVAFILIKFGNCYCQNSGTLLHICYWFWLQT